MPTRKATASWNGDLQGGTGNMAFGGGAFEGAFSFRSRFEDGAGTNPEELIAAAHAGCFSMALSNILAEAGHTPESVNTTANVSLEMTDDDGPTITKIELNTEADVPGLDNETFQQHAEAAKAGCPVSKALAGPTITLNAKLTSGASA
ncbi:MAG: OsmC family peroxiredoxin [Bacteroidetes bacterium]|nr:OsmC family peroxiredoxin [Bacteroidota bacterium]